MRKYILALMTLVLGACSTSERQIAETIKRNPKIVFDVIEENPEQFIEAVNKAARKDQERRQAKQMEELKRQQEDQIKNPLKPVLSTERRLMGAADGKIVIVEYADFQCPACGMAHENLKKVLQKYGDRVQFYYKNMPLSFHKMAYPAATYYEAVAKQDRVKAKDYFNYLFENQEKMKDEAFLKETAKKMKVDMKRLATDILSEGVKKTISDDMAEFEKFGFTGTPVLVVNGVALHGAQPAEVIEKTIMQTIKN
jgi:protein-disulfide isomerase